jgi:hypothetical protein
MPGDENETCDPSGPQRDSARDPVDGRISTHPLRVITVDRRIDMHPASAADILDDLDDDLLGEVWDVLIETLTGGEGHESDEHPQRAFYLEPGQEHVLARQLLDFRDSIPHTDPDMAAKLAEPEDGLREYLNESVEVGYCRASAGEGGDWFTDYVQVPAGLDETAKAAAAVRAGEQRAATEHREVVHVFVYCLDVPRPQDLG